MKPLWTLAGLTLTALAILGALLPVMPSTVFAIGATACFARSSPRLEGWLLTHPRLGPAIRAWRNDGAIPAGAKRIAVASMTASGVLVAATAPAPVALGTAMMLTASAAFVVSRPSPRGVEGRIAAAR